MAGRCLDLDKVKKEKDFIQFGGKKKYFFKDLSLHELKAIEDKMTELSKINPNTDVDEEAIKIDMREIIGDLIDIPEDILSMIEPEHFEAIMVFINRKPLYDKGFDDREIDALEKKIEKKRIMDALEA